MPESVIQAALKQGLWSALFVVLLWWVLKENKQREDRYLAVIKTLSEDVLERVKEATTGLDRLEELVKSRFK